MCLLLKIRDWVRPRGEILKEVKIESGFHILDFGCGPGSYSIVAAKLVGPTGKVYSLDVHPLAIERVHSLSSKSGLKNIETIHSDCATGLESGSVDVVLLTDIFHMLKNRSSVLTEAHRVLKPAGILAFSDHHMKENEILSKVPSGGLFKLSRKGKRIYIFAKQ
ncbi:MAG: class I SAM-dependent methyltransferase [Candidatus Abyssobacteria bacterium SURF_17]|uniref:Class I SAM-dependent methyltransferase n=1 Tax=Candidatus Abyssobacteria bacterium SURF_17 TaxID=2093361 RepID=A0A419EQH1_9BACT|nr:MAG: class I SAM-dependent methyltransferase [Candidatus Abyssubacteria bacterium SURF_17]